MEQEVAILDEILFQTVRRRSLLPLWIKAFSWFFMITGAFTPLIFIIGMTGTDISLSLYGLETTQAFSSSGLIIMSLFLFKGLAAFGLWLEKDQAIKVAKWDAIAGIIVCSFVSFLLPMMDTRYFVRIPLELALLIPYLIKLNRIQHSW